MYSFSSARIWTSSLVGHQTCVQFRLAYSIGAGYSTVRHAQVIAKAYDSDIFAILGAIFKLIFPEPQTGFELYWGQNIRVRRFSLLYPRAVKIIFHGYTVWILLHEKNMNFAWISCCFHGISFDQSCYIEICWVFISDSFLQPVNVQRYENPMNFTWNSYFFHECQAL